MPSSSVRRARSELGAVRAAPRATGWAGKMTTPTRRTEELARIERLLLQSEEGHKTSVMESMSLVESERLIAQGSASSAPADPAVPDEPVKAKRVHASSVTAKLLAIHRRRSAAVFLVVAVMGVAVALLAVTLSRRGFSIPEPLSARLLQWVR